MLLDSFARLVRTESPFQETYLALQKFFEGHDDWQLIDPTIIAKQLPLLDSFALAGALNDAVSRGILRVRYTVLTPDGVVATDLFDSPSAISSTLPDRFEEPFETSRFPLVTVFEAAASSAQNEDRDDGYLEMEASS